MPKIEIPFQGRLVNSKFAKNVAKMFAGNVAAQSIIFISAPIITRLFDPDEFGIMILLEASIMIGAVIANLRYERAIMLPKDDEDAEHLLSLCIILNVGMSLISLLVVAIAGDKIAELLGVPSLGKWLWFVPAGVFLFGIREPLTYWFGRKREFGIVAWAQFFNSSCSVLIKIIAGIIYGSSAAWLIIGNLSGLLFSTIPLTFRYIRGRWWILLRNLSKERIISVGKKYKKFPIFSSWTALVNAIAEDIPVFMLSYYYSVTVVGYFALANKILRKPITIISQSITKVLLEKIARLNANNEPIDRIFKKATLGLGAIGIIPIAIIFLFGPQIFSFCFGENWNAAGDYARILAPWLFLAFMVAPANQVITVRQKLKFNLMFHIGIAVARMLALIIGSTISNNPEVPLAFLSAVSTLLFIFYILFAYHLVSQKMPKKAVESSDIEFLAVLNNK